MATVVMLDVPSTVFVVDMVIVQTCVVLSNNYAVATYVYITWLQLQLLTWFA